MPSNKALLVVDAQVAFSHLSRPLYNGDIVLDNIRTLIDRARAAGAPIVYLQHSGGHGSAFEKGSPGWQIHPSITPRQEDSVIEKQKADAFQGTALEDRLKQLSVGAIVVCGFVTEGCIDTTVRRASGLGFNVELVRDGHSTTDGEVLSASQIVDHHNSVLAIFAAVMRANDIRFDV
jgi:nicotinamidase-related amidase